MVEIHEMWECDNTNISWKVSKLNDSLTINLKVRVPGSGSVISVSWCGVGVNGLSSFLQL